MRQQSLEVLRECPRVEHLVLASPNYQRRQLRLCELRLEPGKAGQRTSLVVKRNPARPRPGQKPSLRVRQDRVISGKRLAAELVAIDIGAAAPVEGTFATKVIVIPNRTKTPDDTPAGTMIATVKVTMSRSGAPFTGRLVSSNALFAFRGMNVVLARSLARKDDGIHNTRITALQ